MKLKRKIILTIIAIIMAPLVLSNIWSFVVEGIFRMPSEMKKEEVCFLAPGLTWNSSMSDVAEVFGKPVEKGVYNDITGNTENTYETEYQNHPMTVYATKRAFMLTEMFCRNKVHEYVFLIECFDEEDARSVFENLCSGLVEVVKSNERVENLKNSENEFALSINYGAPRISYDIELFETNGEYTVRFVADALY